ncbi:MAG: hypothetical protein AAB490_05020 [Patescibacteria group bacterium]
MRYAVRCFGILLIMAMPSACGGGPKPQPTSERIENVQRVFYHERSRYTIMTMDPTTKKAAMRTFYSDVSLFFDVENGQPMWALHETVDYTHDFNQWIPVTQTEIHMTSPSAVEGGAWNHGKFGSGSTEVIR